MATLRSYRKKLQLFEWWLNSPVRIIHEDSIDVDELSAEYGARAAEKLRTGASGAAVAAAAEEEEEDESEQELVDVSEEEEEEF